MQWHVNILIAPGNTLDMCVCYRLVVIPTTMNIRAMPTINIHELQVCKQQQIASGTKTCKFIRMQCIFGEQERSN